MNVSAPIYYAGFDPGSGNAALQVLASDGIDLPTDIAAIESMIADIDPNSLLNRGDVDSPIASVLDAGECLISWNGNHYGLGDLVKQGRNARDELGNPNRYWGDHAKVLLLVGQLPSPVALSDSLVVTHRANTSRNGISGSGPRTS